jgi:HD-GYP domain-containing protein (c-di-GMP phosphodiesterase class II)
MGGLLHDVGKIAIDDAILRKPGGLTEDEYAKMKVHPERGARLLQDSKFLVPLIPYALYHHERFDGKGYPFGLAGDDIPLEGRVLAVADTFDAMTSNRPYRKGLDIEFALQEIEKGKGTQFDPECADALARSHANGRLERILQDYHKHEKKSIACPFCSTFVRVPEGAEAGFVMQCNVCHRHIKLQFKNNAYYGILLATTDAKSQQTHSVPVSK